MNKKSKVMIMIIILLLTYVYIVKDPEASAKTPNMARRQIYIDNQLPSVCTNPEPVEHVYDPSRLIVLDPCKTVSGTVLKVINEEDGDTHIRLKVDPQYSDTLNKANIDGNNAAIEIICGFDHFGVSPTATAALPCGNLVVEIVCVSDISENDAKDACIGYDNKIKIPRVNDHVVITGQFVSDIHHGGWNEIHPVYKIDAD